MGKIELDTIKLHCEDCEKETIASRIREYLADKEDWIEGNILVSTGFESVQVTFIYGCENVDEFIKVIGF